MDESKFLTLSIYFNGYVYDPNSEVHRKMSLSKCENPSHYLQLLRVNGNFDINLWYSIDGGSWVKTSDGKIPLSLNSGTHTVKLYGDNEIFNSGRQGDEREDLMSSYYRFRDYAEFDYAVPMQGIQHFKQFTDSKITSLSGHLTSLLSTDCPTTITENGLFPGLFDGWVIEDMSNLTFPTNVTKCCYAGMFANCHLGNMPTILPATELQDYCYDAMFAARGINGKKLYPPQLPANKLAPYCYFAMFFGLDIYNFPTLPATELEESCYQSMFFGTSGPTQTPTLPATSLKDKCYADMFACIFTLKTLSPISATTLAPHCCEEMFTQCSGVTGTTNYFRLYATTLKDSSYKDMFYGCTNLRSCPKFSANQVAPHCCEGMFEGCSNILYPPSLPATELKDSCYKRMFKDTTYLYYPPKLNAFVLADNCYESMFENSGIYSFGMEALPASTAKKECYKNMFKNCHIEASPMDLNLTTLAENCCEGMFENSGINRMCTLPVTELKKGCYRNMFKNCSRLKTTRPLPAKVLSEDCYRDMLNGTNITSIQVGFTHRPVVNFHSLYGWLDNTNASGTVIQPQDATWDENAHTIYLPQGWTVEKA